MKTNKILIYNKVITRIGNSIDVVLPKGIPVIKGRDFYHLSQWYLEKYLPEYQVEALFDTGSKMVDNDDIDFSKYDSINYSITAIATYLDKTSKNVEMVITSDKMYNEDQALILLQMQYPDSIISGIKIKEILRSIKYAYNTEIVQS